MRTSHDTFQLTRCIPFAAAFARAAIVAVGMLLTLPQAGAQLAYDVEYPQMAYGKQAPQDPFTRVMAELAQQGGELPHDASGRGHLDGLLAALGIDPSSQVLVFSKTSLKQRFISPEIPRSLFFNDEVYVGFVPGGRTLEIAAMDPVQGPVFFDFSQDPAAAAPFKQETSRCLRCHDSYSLTGGGVPRLMLSSVIAGADGNLVSHELSEITDISTPIDKRWGGWYVTGQSGKQNHLGNFVVRDISMLSKRPWQGVSNQDSLQSFVDLSAYPRQTSDIVALLVLQHQVEVQNRLVRLQFESRKLLDTTPAATADELMPLVQPVLEALFMVHEAPLQDAVHGNADYRQWFEQQGPATSDGLSLREFDLQSRTFKHRLSYLVYSDAVSALLPPVQELLFSRIAAVLDGEAGVLGDFTLPEQERAAIKAILRETKPEILEAGHVR